jgi:hypothetical protein
MPLKEVGKPESAPEAPVAPAHEVRQFGALVSPNTAEEPKSDGPAD